VCGIAGFLGAGIDSGEAARILTRMNCAICHRGPDDEGIWTDPDRGVALGHRRLSVIDLSDAGSQPMTSRDGRFILVFNGEIYNFLELRARLARMGETFRGHSDTEVMLAAISRWGLEAAVREFVGMFAFALWDRDNEALSLVRDRFGEKPLYYGWMNGVLLFGSELKALRSHPAWRGTIDRHALTLFLRYNYVPAPHSIYEGVRKVEPSSIVTIRRDATFATHRYWLVEEVAARGMANPLIGDETAILTEIAGALTTSVKDQMVADVPLGAFLSGGIDSSAIVAIMQAESGRPVRTFTIGFEEAGYDEAAHAKTVARHLGTDHTELYVTAGEARAVIPRLPLFYDEPFADSSQIPTFLVAQLARAHVTVALSGDGGDEIFGGYNRYVVGSRLWRRVARFPVALRQAVARAIRSVSPNAWEHVAGWTQPALPAHRRISHPGDRVHKLAAVLAAASERDFYQSMVSQWQNPGDVIVDGYETADDLAGAMSSTIAQSFVERMMVADARTYLTDDIMVKVDRAAMAVSLETRAPFLDHRLVELVWRVPLAMKLRGGVGKWALRQIVQSHVPARLLERPKMGFGVPIDSWLRGPLREWASELLDADRIRREGYLQPALITEKWRQHLSGSHNWQHQLWGVLMFQQWLEAQTADAT
jgi:asparagine synthase (glutamine-hydrolysing)